MHTNEPLIYTGIGAEQFKALEALAQKHGLSIVGTSGQTKKDGYEVSWDYETSTETLTIKILQSPFFIPHGMIVDHFNSWIDETKPAAEPAPATT